MIGENGNLVTHVRSLREFGPESGNLARSGARIRKLGVSERCDPSGMCICGNIAEDNARFILLAIVLAVYMLAGAALFQTLEADLEIHQVLKISKIYFR